MLPAVGSSIVKAITTVWLVMLVGNDEMVLEVIINF